MKLPDFSKHNWLKNLRNIARANLIEYDSSIKWDPLLNELKEKWRVEWLKSKDITIAEDWTLELNWEKIVVYIRDQNNSWENNWYKYHFYNCATLKKYQSQMKFDWKYVANTHWPFIINIVNFWNIIKRDIETDLNVCINCLTSFKYKEYWKNLSQEEKDEIYNNFTREEYFKHFKSPVEKPKHTHISKPINIYADNWSSISKKVREKAWNKCSKCWSLKNIQVHHKDEDKTNNNIRNLEVLCHNCHAEYHPHMKKI